MIIQTNTVKTFTISSFFSYYIFHPGEAPTSRDQTISYISTIALGVFSLFSVHAICYLFFYNRKVKPITVPQRDQKKTDQVFKDSKIIKKEMSPKTLPKIVITEEKSKEVKINSPEIFDTKKNKRNSEPHIKDISESRNKKKHIPKSPSLTHLFGHFHKHDVTQDLKKLEEIKEPKTDVKVKKKKKENFFKKLFHIHSKPEVLAEKKN